MALPTGFTLSDEHRYGDAYGLSSRSVSRQGVSRVRDGSHHVAAIHRSVCGGSSPPISTTDVALEVVQDRVTGLPAAVEVAGLELNERICTWPTVTVVLAWIWPVALVAVRV